VVGVGEGADLVIGRGIVGALVLAAVLACGGVGGADGPAADGGGVAVEPTAALLQVSAKFPDDPVSQGEGYMDATGRLVVPPPARGPERVEAPAFVVHASGGCAWIDRSGGRVERRPLGPGKACHDLGGDRALVVTDDALVVHDRSGAEVARLARPKGSSAPTPPRDGDGPIAWCEGRQACGYLDAGLTWIGSARYAQAEPFSGGRGVVVGRDGKRSLIDAGGAVYGSFELLFGFGDGVALALDGGEPSPDTESGEPYTYQASLVDGEGRRVAELGLRQLRSGRPEASLRPSDGKLLLPPRPDTDAVELVDTTGRVLHTLPAAPTEGWTFSDGLAAARVDGGWRYVDATGKVVLPGPYPLGGAFQGGFARVARDRWIRKDGSEIRVGGDGE
jgi:hypothetical protein